jgi:hypothetical protein
MDNAHLQSLREKHTDPSERTEQIRRKLFWGRDDRRNGPPFCLKHNIYPEGFVTGIIDLF